jgi:hypothetical protein
MSLHAQLVLSVNGVLCEDCPVCALVLRALGTILEGENRLGQDQTVKKLGWPGFRVAVPH